MVEKEVTLKILADVDDSQVEDLENVLQQIVDGKITEQYIEKIKISYNKFITALYKTQIDDIEDAVKDIVDNAYCSAQTY